MRGSYLFFPFSHISQDQLNALETFFPSFIFFPAASDLEGHPQMQKLVERGVSGPVFLPKEALRSVNHTFEQYLAWAKVHKGNEHNLRFLLKDNPYFTSDSDLTNIKSQIRGVKGTIEPKQTEKNVLHQALLFLKMAKQCDQDNESIDGQLRNIDKTRNSMLSALLGEEDPTETLVSRRKTSSPDPGAMMIHERIHAWSRCMTHYIDASKAGESPVFVTTSEAVVDYLETICSDVINALDINPIKVHENDCENKTGWQQYLSEYVMCAAKGPAGKLNHPPEVKDGCSRFGQIKLSLFSGNNIHSLFNLKDKQIWVCLIRLK